MYCIIHIIGFVRLFLECALKQVSLLYTVLKNSVKFDLSPMNGNKVLAEHHINGQTDVQVSYMPAGGQHNRFLNVCFKTCF